MSKELGELAMEHRETYLAAFWRIYEKHPNGHFFCCYDSGRLMIAYCRYNKEAGELRYLLAQHTGLFACNPASLGYVVIDVTTRDDAYLYSQIERIMGAPAFTTQTPYGSHLWYRLKPGEIFEFGSYSKPHGISVRCYNSPVGHKGTGTASHVVLWHPEQFDLNDHRDDAIVTAAQLEKLRQAEIRPKEDKSHGEKRMDDNVPKRVETRVGPLFEKSDDELRETEARFRIDGYITLFDSHVVALELLVRRYEHILSQYDGEKVANKSSVGQMLRSIEDDVSNAIGRLSRMAENLENDLFSEDTEVDT